MEDGEWTGSGIAGQFSAVRLCRSEPDARRGSCSRRDVRPARANLAVAESRHAELEQEYGHDHPRTLQAHREKADVMRLHGTSKWCVSSHGSKGAVTFANRLLLRSTLWETRAWQPAAAGGG